MSLKSRTKTMILLVNRMEALTESRESVKNELKSIQNLAQGKAIKKRELFKLLYSSRSIDTFLKTFLDFYSIRGGTYSIGQYIDKLENHSHSSLGRITAKEKNRFKSNIANVRNRYLHTADSYPCGAQETSKLLSEIDALMVRIEKLRD